uniref:Uncharacterized protein n=1 Tax=Amphiprion percula TaxID=161767 RepID=A0A3P8U2D9_AMPPE
MAPTITAAIINSQEHLTLTHKVNWRFMDTLTSFIRQLKSLLGPQFLKQQPDSKLEKADVLEMRVCFLRRLQQQHQAVNTAAVDQGYSSCIREMMYFLRLLNHFNKLQLCSDNNLTAADNSPLSSTVQTSITKDKSPVNSVLWRSW